MFSSLRIRNYRLYYFSQIISFTGSFLQTIAYAWLILKLTDSGTMMGLVLSAQYLPMLIFTPYGGLIADKFSKLKLIYATQVASALMALLLGLLVLFNAVQIWMVFAFAFGLGIIDSMDHPARNAFLFELVGNDKIKSATGLWTSLMSFTRIMGPALGGVIIVMFGLGPCFIINALTYIPVFIALSLIRATELHIDHAAEKTKQQIKEGVKYVISTPNLLLPMVMMIIVGTITYEWTVSMPLFAKFTLNGGAGAYATISVAMGAGMLIGGLFSAIGKNVSQKSLVYAAMSLGAVVLIASTVANLIAAVIAFIFVGIFERTFTTLNMTSVQINTDSKMRGRLMAFWSMAYVSSTAIGGPAIGWVGQHAGARWSLAVGGVAAILASFFGLTFTRRLKRAVAFEAIAEETEISPGEDKKMV